MKNVLFLSMLIVLSLSCNKKQQQTEEPPLITQQIPDIENGLMAPETLWYFARIGEFKVSPDAKNLLMTVTFFSIEQNKSNREIFLLNLETQEKTQLTSTPAGEFNLCWKPDNKSFGFLYPDDNGEIQLFEMNIDGSGRKKVSSIKGGISGFSYSPDMKHLFYLADIPRKPELADLHPDMPMANVRIIDELMYRHWDQWVQNFTHIFTAPYSNNITEGTDIMKGEHWESPVRPFGGTEQITWSPDSRSIVYTCRKLKGVEYSKSTNTDLYSFHLETGETINLTEGMHGYDMNPVFSPDGRRLAWESMERDGYEADKHRLIVLDLNTGEKKDLTAGFDANAYNITWSEDGKTIYFTTDWFGSKEIFSVDVDGGAPVRITEGIHDYIGIAPAGKDMIAMRQSMSKPAELYKVNLNTGTDEEISFVNKELLAKLRMGRVEKRFIKTTDGKDMLTWIIYPPDFDPAKRYPTLLYCQGGPQGMVSQFWSYRWNFQMMAAHGYIIVAPNRRGLTGFGMEWLEQISGDYGGQNIKDYLSAIDEMAKESFVDETKLGAIGASYGGYSVFHLAGIHNKRFKAFISHAGIFNFDSQYLETEELWFPDWDYGGAFWEVVKPNVKRSYAASPHLMVHKWDTPILIIHGEKDFRISFTQSMQAFNAAQILGVPSKLVLFPEENHWILKPQNAIIWQREFFAWLDRYLKNSAE
jgi:dipeptidyl aminopeptidase/acylaminoacyl peptidase